MVPAAKRKRKGLTPFGSQEVEAFLDEFARTGTVTKDYQKHDL
jgi:hypothetical protein